VRRGIATVLILLGAFLIVVGVMAQFYAPDRLQKTPLGSDTTTNLSGTAQLSDGAGGLDSTPVIAFSVTHGDTERSDDDVAVFQTSSCLVKDVGEIDTCVSADDPEERLLSASTDNFATDRVTALAINDPDYLPADAVPHEGLVNKWPFDAQQETYPYWDGLVGSAVDAVFDRETELDGLEVYVYKITIEDAPIEVTDGVQGTYNDEKEIYIEPVTGQIMHQVDHQERLDSDGNPLLILDLSFTEQQVADNVADGKSNANSLSLLLDTVPLIGYLAGIPLLLIGIVLSVLAARRSSEPAEQTDTKATSSV
jgi:Porin PorA